MASLLMGDTAVLCKRGPLQMAAWQGNQCQLQLQGLRGQATSPELVWVLPGPLHSGPGLIMALTVSNP